MYKKKYLKYKLKYLNLKNKQNGGSKEYNILKTLEESDLSYKKLLSELDKTNNKIMIVFYAPWCHFCQKFIENPTGTYIDLIKSPELNIYKVDITNRENKDVVDIENKILELDNVLGQIVAFPTLLKIDIKNKKISHFKGNREDINMIKKFFNE